MSTKCERWKRDPLINPETGKTIKLGGPTFSRLEKECASRKISKSKTKSPRLKTPSPSPRKPRHVSPRKSLRRSRSLEKDCEKWFKEPTINPITGRRIKENGPTFKAWEKDCEKWKFVKEPQLSSSGVILDWNESRLKNADDIKAFLEKKRVNDPKNPKICFSGNNVNFRKSLTWSSKIGEGSYGDIYLAKIGSLEFVVKEAHMDQKNIDNLEEYGMMKLASELVKKICPNFPIVYDIGFCESCRWRGGPSGWCNLMFLERANYDLLWLLKNIDFPNDASRERDQYFFSILFQILFGVYALHSYFGFYHRDIKASNCLLKYIQPEGYIRYIVGQDVFYVRNYGELIMISDFGVGYSVMPKYSQFGFQKSHGARNAVVLPSKRLKPITCEFSVSKAGKLEPATKRAWNNGKLEGTHNFFEGDFNLKPSVPVDLNDMKKYPAMEYFNDIQDAVRLIAGGHRTVQSGDHPAWPLTRENRNKLEKECVRSSFPYTTDAVRFLNAVEMVKVLYEPPTTIPQDNVITFVME